MNWRFLFMWSAVCLAATTAAVLHTSLRFRVVRVGYALSEAKRAQRQLLATRHLLTIERATLRDPRRLEALAETQLGMKPPRSHQRVHMAALMDRSAAGQKQ